jgi:hypothetical protein
MIYGLTVTRHQQIEKELNRMEAFLLDLGKEIQATTAPGSRYSHLWLQVDSSVSYVRSLRAALQQENHIHH